MQVAKWWCIGAAVVLLICMTGGAHELISSVFAPAPSAATDSFMAVCLPPAVLSPDVLCPAVLSAAALAAAVLLLLCLRRRMSFAQQGCLLQQATGVCTRRRQSMSSPACKTTHSRNLASRHRHSSSSSRPAGDPSSSSRHTCLCLWPPSCWWEIDSCRPCLSAVLRYPLLLLLLQEAAASSRRCQTALNTGLARMQWLWWLPGKQQFQAPAAAAAARRAMQPLLQAYHLALLLQGRLGRPGCEAGWC